MNKKILISLFAVFVIASYENTYAHGVGGADRSYKFDKSDNTADQESRKKTAEEQEASENWDDFMSAINKQTNKTDAGAKSGQDTQSNQ